MEKFIKGTETILLIDDEVMILDVGTRILKKLGYQVLTAKDGEEAIEIYANNKNEVDLIILDIVMPKIDGGDTLDKLQELNPQVKVLLSSGYSIKGRVSELLKRGGCDFIQKPFTLNVISKKIREVLNAT